MKQLTKKRKIMLLLLTLGIAIMAYEYFMESATEIKTDKANQVQMKHSSSNAAASTPGV